MEIQGLTQDGMALFQAMRKHPNTAFEPMGEASAFRELFERGIIVSHPTAKDCYTLSEAARGIVSIDIDSGARFSVKKTPTGPELKFGDCIVREWLGTNYNAQAEAFCARLNLLLDGKE
jgi:hypothetical protein